MTESVSEHPWITGVNEGATPEEIAAYEAWEAKGEAVCSDSGWWTHWVDTRAAFFAGARWAKGLER